MSTKKSHTQALAARTCWGIDEALKESQFSSVKLRIFCDAMLDGRSTDDNGIEINQENLRALVESTKALRGESYKVLVAASLAERAIRHSSNGVYTKEKAEAIMKAQLSRLF